MLRESYFDRLQVVYKSGVHDDHPESREYEEVHVWISSEGIVIISSKDEMEIYLIGHIKNMTLKRIR